MKEKDIKKLGWKKPAEIEYLDAWTTELEEWVEYNEMFSKSLKPSQSLVIKLKQTKLLINQIKYRRNVLLIRKNMSNTEVETVILIQENE